MYLLKGTSRTILFVLKKKKRETDRKREKENKTRRSYRFLVSSSFFFYPDVYYIHAFTSKIKFLVNHACLSLLFSQETHEMTEFERKWTLRYEKGRIGGTRRRRVVASHTQHVLTTMYDKL